MFGWIDLIKVLVMVFVAGAGWTVDAEATVITFAALALVYLYKLAAKLLKKDPGKAVLTALVFVAAVGLQWLFAPVPLPAFPAYTGELVSYAPIFFAYVGVLFQAVAGVVAAATGIYNLLLADVLSKVTDSAKRFVFGR